MAGEARIAAQDLWIVLPVSGIARGKSRLSAVLARGERSRLNRQLVAHAIGVAVAALGAPARCIVVSPCARTLRMARDAGAAALVEHRPARGLNAAIRQGIAYAARRGGRRVLILHADLPRLSGRLLRRLLRIAGVSACGVVVPDRDRIGTNALVMAAQPSAALHFGPDSFAKHCRSASAAGRVPVVFEDVALAEDLDTAEHLAAWRADGRRWGRQLQRPRARRRMVSSTAAS